MIVCKIKDGKYIDYSLLGNRQYTLKKHMRVHGSALYRVEFFDVKIFKIDPGAIFDDEVIENYIEIGDDGEFLFAKKSDFKKAVASMQVYYDEKKSEFIDFKTGVSL